jgi:predicted nuclease of predicted toxin-antitoxin system
MRLLLDECVPRRLRRDFVGHSVSTVEEAGFKGLKNGQLLSAAAGKFDVLVTVDKNIPFQQNLRALNISILILVAKSNRYQDLKSLAPKALDALKQIQSGETLRVT